MADPQEPLPIPADGSLPPDGPISQRYLVETDKGNYYIDVDMPGPARPNAAGFGENVLKSGVGLAKGAVETLHGLMQNPADASLQMGDAIMHRVKDYAGDVHPLQAARQMMGFEPGGLSGALSNILPVNMMYQDPVGVAGDALAIKGGITGAKSGMSAIKGPGLTGDVIAGMLEKLRPKEQTNLNTPTPPMTGTGEGAIYSGKTGAWSPETAPPEGILKLGSAPSLDEILQTALADSMKPQPSHSVELPPDPTTAGAGSLPKIGTGKRLTSVSSGRPSTQPVGQNPPTVSSFGQARETQPVSAGVTPQPTVSPLERGNAYAAGEPRPTPPIEPIPAHTPTQDSTPVPNASDAEPTLSELQSFLGADRAATDSRFIDFAREFGLKANGNTVRDMTGQPARTPLDLSAGRGSQPLRPGESLLPDTRRGPSVEGPDQSFMRRIMDEKGSFDPSMFIPGGANSLPALLETLLMGYLAGKTGVGAKALRGINTYGGRVVPGAMGGAAVTRLKDPLTPVPSH